MSLHDYIYRTKTFISGDWTGDNGLINLDRSRCFEMIDETSKELRTLSN